MPKNFAVLIGSALLTAVVINPIFRPLFRRFKEKIPLVGYAIAALGAFVVVFSAIFIDDIATQNHRTNQYILKFFLFAPVIISAAYISFLKADNSALLQGYARAFGAVYKLVKLGVPITIFAQFFLILYTGDTFEAPIKIFNILFFPLVFLLYPGFLFMDCFKKIRNSEKIAWYQQPFIPCYYALAGVRFLCDRSLGIQRDTQKTKVPETRIAPTESGNAA